MIAALGSRPSAAQAQQAATLADQAIHKLDLQTELRREAEPPPDYKLNLPPETVWIAVIVGVIVLLYVFPRHDPDPARRPRRGLGGGRNGEARTGPRAPEVVLDAADDLAAQGRFVEAMHVLLLQALADIRRRLDEEFAEFP